MTSNRCSMCEKNVAKCNCTGCKRFFCVKHFSEHRQQLSVQFDYEIVRAHDELLEQINQVNQSNDISIDLFSQIDRWETATIQMIQQAAKRVREQLTEMINRERETLTVQFGNLTKEIRSQQNEENFDEDDVEQLREKINQLYQSMPQQTLKMIIIQNNEIDWNRLISIEKKQTRAISSLLFDIDSNARWTQNGITVAGGNGRGIQLDQLSSPLGCYLDDDHTVVIADYWNHRIVEWKNGSMSGQVVAGGNGPGNGINQLNRLTDVIVDKQTDTLIVCDQGNRRVVRWPRRGGKNGQTIISEILGVGLTMDNDGFLYISDKEKHLVKRWRVGETRGTVVAGTNGAGDRLDQLNCPGYIFVDRDHSVYVSDSGNHRLMKWMAGAKEGIVVAGGHGEGNALTQLSRPQGVVVDQFSTVYVSDMKNNRIMRWLEGGTQGSIVVGENDSGSQANQLNWPMGLSFDRHGNLYVVDAGNDRVQKFSIDRRS